MTKKEKSPRLGLDMAKKSPDINLLKKGQVNILEQVFNWAVKAGRVIVITVEIVALSAFLYRFSLDRQLIDLRSEIKEKQALVEFFSENEKIYRNLQDRLSTASDFSSQSGEKIKLLNDLVGFVPNEMSLDNFSLYEDRINIKATTNSVLALSLFIDSLKDYPSIQNLSVDKIENKPSSSFISFGISANLETKK